MTSIGKKTPDEIGFSKSDVIIVSVNDVSSEVSPKVIDNEDKKKEKKIKRIHTTYKKKRQVQIVPPEDEEELSDMDGFNTPCLR